MRISILTALAAIAAPSALQAQAQDLGATSPVTGAWTYRQTPALSEAVFSNAIGAPQLTIRCARPTRVLTISKNALAPASALSIWTSSDSRTLAASFNSTTAEVTATVPLLDPLLDAMAFSRGRIGFATPGVTPLVVPSWPDAAHVVEDCRT